MQDSNSSKYQDAHCYDSVLILADEERLEQIEAENAQPRRELDGVWKFLAEVFDGRFPPSKN